MIYVLAAGGFLFVLSTVYDLANNYRPSRHFSVQAIVYRLAAIAVLTIPFWN